MGDFLKKELEEEADTPTITGDAIEHYQKHAPGEPGIAFCVSVAHAVHVAESFRAAGYEARHVDGGMNQTDRDAALNGLATGEVQIVTTCDLISEGVDVPACSVGILLRPTKSLGLFLQQVGRTLRVAPGRERALILDHAGNCRRHGMMPDTDYDWKLEGDKDRLKKQKDEGIERVRECPECFATFDLAKACPFCGYEIEINPREIEEIDGQLVPISEADLKRRDRGPCPRRPAWREPSRKAFRSGWP